MTSARTTLLYLAGLALLATLPAVPARSADEPDPEPGPTWPKTTQADRLRSTNNLKQIGIAFHNFHDVMGAMPASAIYSKANKPLLSWRVAILPYIEEQPLYKEFKLDEPWDSKHNKKLLDRMPKIYAPTIQGRPAKPNTTYYQVFTGNGAPFDPRTIRAAGLLTLGPRLTNFTDGTSNTILVAEGKTPVPWTKPDDLAYDAAKALPKLGGLFREGFHITMADGSVRFIGQKINPVTLRALITPNGGEIIDWRKIPLAKPEGRK
jgi:hypothetical protein